MATGDHLFSSMIPTIVRMRLSVPPPGAKGTTTSMVLVGYLAWAPAVVASVAMVSSATTVASARWRMGGFSSRE